MNLDPKDTQPFRNPDDHRRRTYVPAVWSAPGEGGGHPKISGGYEVNEHGTPMLTRGLNNRDQRYLKSVEDLQAGRVARAATEYGASVILRDSPTQIGIRAPSGNNYDVTYPITGCDCPDRWRLVESGKGEVQCKHMLMATAAILAAGSFDNLPVSCEYVSLLTGFSIRDIQRLCQEGFFTAVRNFGVWMIGGGDPVLVASQITDLLARVVSKPNWVSVDELLDIFAVGATETEVS